MGAIETEAMVLTRHGGPEVLERRTIELGAPGPREVRVRVHAVAMNHMDLWVRRGGPAFKLTYPHRLGCDIAGVVEELGPGARGVAVGERVMVAPGLSCGACRACLSGRDNLCRSYRILGENAQGGYSRHVIVPDQNLIPIGDALGFAEAAALPLCTLTAWQMVIRKAAVRPGQTVVVHAAGSGVSVMIIQLCKMLGARIIATTGSRAKVSRARALGVAHVIDTSYDSTSGPPSISLGRDPTAPSGYVDEIKHFTGKAGADVIFDHVGGELLENAVLAVARGGRIVTCGATASPMARLDLRYVYFRQIELLGSTMGSKGDLFEALPMMLDGRLQAPIDRIVSLWDAREAHEALEARKVFGKVVLSVD